MRAYTPDTPFLPEQHPDKNGDALASDAFKALQAAHAVLSDPQNKREYDLSMSARGFPRA